MGTSIAGRGFPRTRACACPCARVGYRGRAGRRSAALGGGLRGRAGPRPPGFSRPRAVVVLGAPPQGDAGAARPAGELRARALKSALSQQEMPAWPGCELESGEAVSGVRPHLALLQFGGSRQDLYSAASLGRNSDFPGGTCSSGSFNASSCAGPKNRLGFLTLSGIREAGYK